MRAAIFLGLMYIGAAIKGSLLGDTTVTAMVFLLFIAMDAIELINKLSKRK